MKLYIAGPISDTADYKERFQQGMIEVAQLGHAPISPVEVAPMEGLEWVEYMKLDIRTLLQCEGVYMLVGWENSRGARLEHMIATALEMVVVYQRDRQ